MCGDIIRPMDRITVSTTPTAAGNRPLIAQSEWCNYRVISLPVDYVIHSRPEQGYDRGREAAGIAEAWRHAASWDAFGLLLLGCDVAADPDDLEAMTAAILERPGALHTGMVKLWPESTGRDDWIWSHRRGTLGFPAATQDESAPVAYVSLGFLWVPGHLLDLAASVMPWWRHGEADVALSELALANGVPAYLVPSCRPKHLHFQGEHDGRAIQSRTADSPTRPSSPGAG